MRKILFRGKRDDIAWVYGDLCYKSEVTGVACDYIISTRDRIIYPVTPETIGRYTGFNDKNNVKIFEGDFVKSGVCVAVVAFEKGAFVLKDDCGYTHKIVILKQAIFEVVGNIHDNPELLKR